jgi:lipopolysaccharide transport system permease protein
MVISNLIKFAIQFALFLGFLAYFRLRDAAVHPNWAVLLTPVLLLLMAALGLGVGIIVSALTTKYRDLQVLVTFGVQLAMYATPVIYPLSMFPNAFRWMIIVNPVAPIIEAFRYGFLGEGLFSWSYLGISAGIIGAILFLGILLFNHVERTFMDTV